MQEIKRIIVSVTGDLKSLILAIPSLYLLKKMYPQSELILLVRKDYYEIVEKLSYINRILKMEDFRQEMLLTKIAFFKADVFIALHHNEYIGKLVKASKVKIKIGPISKPSLWLLYKKGVFQNRENAIKNEAEYNLDLIQKLNPMRYSTVFELNTNIVLGEENRKVAELFWKQAKITSKVLCCYPFFESSIKNLSIEEYARILKKCIETLTDIEIILIGDIDEEEKLYALKEKIGSTRVHLFANGGSILNLAAVIEKSSVYFGGVTGYTHLAGCLEKKMLVVYPNKKIELGIRWEIYRKYLENVFYFIPKDSPGEEMAEDYFTSINSQEEENLVKMLVEALV